MRCWRRHARVSKLWLMLLLLLRMRVLLKLRVRLLLLLLRMRVLHVRVLLRLLQMTRRKVGSHYGRGRNIVAGGER